MLWFIVQPVKITFLLVGGVVVLSTACAPLVGWRRSRTLLWTGVIGFLLFVPSCQGVMKIMDKSRFGGFAYTDFESVDNERVARWLPPSSSDITAYCRSNGHDARFNVARDDLVSWFSDYRAEFGWGRA